MKRVGVDSLPRVTEDEALELMVHHLELASIYYEATSSNHQEVVHEIITIMTRNERELALQAALVWIDKMQLQHDELAKTYP